MQLEDLQIEINARIEQAIVQYKRQPSRSSSIPKNWKEKVADTQRQLQLAMNTLYHTVDERISRSLKEREKEQIATYFEPAIYHIILQQMDD